MKSDIGTTVIETESFVKQAAAIWSPADLDQLKDYVARNPLAGGTSPAAVAILARLAEAAKAGIKRNQKEKRK